jgi:O-antigen ligase
MVVLTMALILSRSRAAWLASLVFLGVGIVLLAASRRYWRGGHVGGRLARSLLAIAIGGLIAVALPNDLDWNSNSPYLDSAKKVVDYSSGSGKGRIAQYQNSLDMSLSDPVFGAGPGNWPVRYPKFAPGGDKSLVSSGMTANPWPSSDWVAFVSERGIVGALTLAAVFAVIFFRALRGWKEHERSEMVLLSIAVAGTVVSTMVVSAFDAVLLLPAPAFLAWMILGAGSGARRGGRVVDLSGKSWALGVFMLLAVCLLDVARSGAQVKAMYDVGTGTRRAGWVSGAKWDPGSYRIEQRVAELYANRGDCRTSRIHSRRALELFPYSPQARRTARRCGIKVAK